MKPTEATETREKLLSQRRNKVRQRRNHLRQGKKLSESEEEQL
jgi:hypothetical protein